jgi:hypothetical protein
MEFLKSYLNDFGYKEYTVNLPATFKSFETIYTSFKKQLFDLDTTSYTSIHLGTAWEV